MADAELSIVIRARDALTAELKRMGTTLDALARQAAGAFGGAGREAESARVSVRQISEELAKAAQAATPLGAAIKQALAGDVGPLEAGLAEAARELEALRARAGSLDFFVGDAERAERLAAEIGVAERALRSVQEAGARIDVGARIAQTEQAFARLGASVSLAPLKSEVARAREQLERMRDSATLAGGAISAVDRQTLDQLEREVTEGERALARIRDQAEQARGAGAAIGPAFAGSRAGITALSGAVHGLRSALLPLLPFLTLAGAAFAVKRSINDARDFAESLSDIRAQADLTERELETLRSGALETTRALGLSEAEEGEALLQAVTDGAKDAAQGLAIFNAAARLGVVANTDTAKAVDLLTTAINAFRAQGLDAARAADIAFETIRSGKVNVDDLAGAIDSVAPLVAGLGLSFEDLSAVIATATIRGGGFEQAIAGVRGILNVLTNAGPAAKAALEGIPFDAQALAARGLVPVLRDITDRLGGNIEALREVFPDGRSFAAILAVLSDGGEQLTRTLQEIERSTGGVAAALDRKLQDPTRQMTVLFSNLRSAFEDAFGGVFFTSVSNAVKSMGGMAAATKAVADIGRGLGDAFSVVLPPMVIGIADLAKAVVELNDVFAGSGEAFREFGGIGLTTIKFLTSGFLTLIQVADLALDIIKAGSQGGFIFSGLSEEDTNKLNVALLRTGDILRELVATGAVEDPFAISELRQKLAALPESIRPTISPTLDEASLKQIRLQLLTVFNEEQASVTLRQRLRAALDEFDQDVSTIGRQALDDLDRALGRSPKPIEIPVSREQLQAAERDVAALENRLASLGVQAQQIDLDDVILSGGEALRMFGEQAADVQFFLEAARNRANELRAALAQSIAVEIAEKEAELARFDQGLADARSQAELLGVAGTEMAAALGAAFETDRTKALRAELERFRAELRALKGEIPETLIIEPRVGELPDLRAILRTAIEGARGALDRLVDPGLLARLGREAGAALRDGIIEEAGQADPFEAVLAQFRGGVEPSLERQSQLIQEQVDRQREAVAQLREALPVMQALGLLSEARVDLLDLETDRLEESVDLLQRSAALDRSRLRREALEVGVEFVPDEAELHQRVAEARDQLERERFALRLGVEVDDRAIVDAQSQIAAVRDKLERSALEREAINFGLAVEGRAIEQLELDVEQARDQAQAFADELDAGGVRRTALVLGISIEGKSVEQLKQDISSVQEETRAFQEEHPQQLALAQDAAQGLAGAFADIATGTRSASEAFRDFAQSFLRQMIQMIARSLILRSILSAFGLSPEAATAIVGGRSGLVVPQAHGGVWEPAHGSITREGLPAYALGGSPYVDRIVAGPTVEDARRLAGTAIVPLSGGGVETRGGRHLPVRRGSTGELEVQLARGAADLRALFGEAGREAVMRLHAAPGGRPGVRASDGGVLPLRRVTGGRLGVDAYGAGGIPYQAGGLPGQGQGTQVSVEVTVPVVVQIAARRERDQAIDEEELARRLQALIARRPEIREAVQAVVIDGIEQLGSYRASVRGDRV